MRLLVGHYTKSRGTTDYFIAFLESQKLSYYYLAHPLEGQGVLPSRLTYFDGKTEVVVKEYATPKITYLAYIANMMLTLRVLFMLRSKPLSRVYGFGSFNAVPCILGKMFTSYKVVFWGVDYSIKRFGNPVLDTFYAWTESFAVRFADLVVQPSIRQQKAREQRHGLNLRKSIIVSNGIPMKPIDLHVRSTGAPAFYYLGSVTEHHGVQKFVTEMYVKRHCTYPLYIFGSGESIVEIEKLVAEHSLEDKVSLMGHTDLKGVEEFLKRSDHYMIGIAPYIFSEDSFVYFGDSLKLKEYVAYDSPFVASKGIYVNPAFRPFCISYASYDELFALKPADFPDIHSMTAERRKVLAEFTYDHLFKKLLSEEDARLAGA